MANRNRGREDLRRPFAARRHAPGTNAGQARVGYPEPSIAMAQAKSLLDAARIAINRFGVPRRVVKMVLDDDKRNNVKLMRLVSLSKKWWARRKAQRDIAVARIATGDVRSVVVPSPNCPLSLAPQHFTCPPVNRAQVNSASIPE